ncbi:hypothetical protein BU17DRAFT_77165 [Hysterangium stoloniferum]|nr:hypothetical protein BU17DRAFT_77165 [Hysterangium stoloniferum]
MDDGLTEEKMNKTDTECGKYYNKYKKACLTSGLMVLWCHHFICLGFHIIPTAEGRNDVFSAIYPSFFCNTWFVIDEFHTKCSKASAASFVMQYDPLLLSVNTSAAEIGNSGAAKICKSASYMTQRHAIQYVKVYMEVMNRC